MTFNLFKSKVARQRDKFTQIAAEFGDKHKNYFVIIADADTNVVVATYKGQVTGFHNKSQSRRIKEMFQFKPEDEKDDGRQSKRNEAIAQFLFEVDGIADALGKQVYNLRVGKKALAHLEKSGDLKIGVEELNEQGNTKSIEVVQGVKR